MSALLVCAPCWVGLHDLCHIFVYDAQHKRHPCRCVSMSHAELIAREEE